MRSPRLMWLGVGVAVLVAFYLLAINSYLATYALGTFQLSFCRFGPTEARILLAIGNVVALVRPTVTAFGPPLRFFDVGGAVAVAAMLVVLGVSVVSNTRKLYRAERV